MVVVDLIEEDEVIEDQEVDHPEHENHLVHMTFATNVEVRCIMFYPLL